MGSLFMAASRLLKPRWVSLALVLALFASASASIDRANWVSQDSEVLRSLGWALILGWLLARARFHPWVVGLYALAASLAAGVQAAGGVMPGLVVIFTRHWTITLNDINLGLFTFWLRFVGWIEAVQNGQTIKDTGLFILLIAVLLWIATLWFTWFWIRKNQALSAVLPLAVLVAINVHLSHQTVSYLVMFLFFVLLLVARAGFVKQVADWDHRRIDYSEELGVEWSVSVVLAAVLVLGLARAAPLVATPQGWQNIEAWVQRRHERNAETAERLFAGVNTPLPQAVQGEPALYVAAPNLQVLGAPLPQGNQTVMWVRTSDPPPFIEGRQQDIPDPENKGHYWRSGIFGTYTGRGWLTADLLAEAVDSQVPAQQPPPGRYYLRQVFEIVAQHDNSLYAVNDPLQVEAGVGLRRTKDGSTLLEGAPSKYAVISAVTRVSSTQLAAAGQEYPPAVQAEYLQLPTNLPGRVRILAARVAGNGSPFEQALRVETYLRENYRYDLNTPPPLAGRDVVDSFLFDAPQGFCSHFASAMVVMLRAQDIPARVVSGYATGSYDTQKFAYRVSQDAVHAWVEVYFPTIGWVEFEPTAARAPFVYSAGELLADGLQPPPDLQPVRQNGLPAALWFGVALLLVAAPFVMLRWFAVRRSQPPSQKIAVLYRQMRRALAWGGLKATSSVTPQEFLQSSQTQLAPLARLSKALAQATALYQQALFSQNAPDAGRVQTVFGLWRKSLRDWFTLWRKGR